MAVIKFQFLLILQRLFLAFPPRTPSRKALIREEYSRLISCFSYDSTLFSVNIDVGKKFRNETFDIDNEDQFEV